jgi:hypothetical protein
VELLRLYLKAQVSTGKTHPNYKAELARLLFVVQMCNFWMASVSAKIPAGKKTCCGPSKFEAK